MKEQPIKIAMTDGKLETIIAVAVFGDWAVHQGPSWVYGRGEPKPAWTITHVPSGMRASCFLTVGIGKGEAIKLARWLSRATLDSAPPDEAFGRSVYRAMLAFFGVDDPTATARSKT